MVWFKVDDGAHSHPKLLMVSLSAVGLWSMAGSWSGMHLTDGFIPDAALPTVRGDEALASELVRVRLWDRVEGGFQFHEWNRDSDGTERNPTSEEVKRKRSVRAAAGRKGGIASGNSRRSSKPGSDGEANAEANASTFVADPLNPRPDPTRPEGSNEPSLFPADAVDTHDAEAEEGEEPKRRKPETDAPEFFPITEKMRAWARKEVPAVADALEFHTQEFLDHHAAKGNRFRDWGRAWHKWMRNAAKFAAERQARPSNVVSIRGNDPLAAKHAMLARQRAWAEAEDAKELAQ